MHSASKIKNTTYVSGIVYLSILVYYVGGLRDSLYLKYRPHCDVLIYIVYHFSFASNFRIPSEIRRMTKTETCKTVHEKVFDMKDLTLDFS